VSTLIRSGPDTDAFTVHSIRTLRTDVLAALGGGATAVSDLGARSSMRLKCASLGVPRRDWALVSRWAWLNDAESMRALDSYVDLMIADRCWKLTDDLMSDLVLADVDGDGLTADDLRAVVTALVTA
jgi:cytochrome P450